MRSPTASPVRKIPLKTPDTAASGEAAGSSWVHAHFHAGAAGRVRRRRLGDRQELDPIAELSRESMSCAVTREIPSVWMCLRSTKVRKASATRICSLWAESIPSMSRVGSVSA